MPRSTIVVTVAIVYYEAMRRELNRRPMYEYRCDERLKAKAEGSTRLGCADSWGRRTGWLRQTYRLSFWNVLGCVFVVISCVKRGRAYVCVYVCASILYICIEWKNIHRCHYPPLSLSKNKYPPLSLSKNIHRCHENIDPTVWYPTPVYIRAWRAQTMGLYFI